ncbi:MAG: M23 family metallopeptidase [Candidatus Peribacteria bacterium]|nr:M23 family metallopeptidase [Candidatus Peribacteria bacterium]
MDYNLIVSSGTYSGNGTINTSDEGTPLYSPIDGKAVLANYTSDYGNRVRIQQTIGNTTIDVYLGHLQYASSTPVGTVVYAGQTIVGYLGQTGASSPHLHMNARIVESGGSLLSVPHSLNAN